MFSEAKNEFRNYLKDIVKRINRQVIFLSQCFDLRKLTSILDTHLDGGNLGVISNVLPLHGVLVQFLVPVDLQLTILDHGLNLAGEFHLMQK